jgi:hypothetical protein
MMKGRNIIDKLTTRHSKISDKDKCMNYGYYYYNDKCNFRKRMDVPDIKRSFICNDMGYYWNDGCYESEDEYLSQQPVQSLETIGEDMVKVVQQKSPEMEIIKSPERRVVSPSVSQIILPPTKLVKVEPVKVEPVKVEPVKVIETKVEEKVEPVISSRRGSRQRFWEVAERACGDYGWKSVDGKCGYNNNENSDSYRTFIYDLNEIIGDTKLDSSKNFQDNEPVLKDLLYKNLDGNLSLGEMDNTYYVYTSDADAETCKTKNRSRCRTSPNCDWWMDRCEKQSDIDAMMRQFK